MVLQNSKQDLQSLGQINKIKREGEKIQISKIRDEKEILQQKLMKSEHHRDMPKYLYTGKSERNG